MGGACFELGNVTPAAEFNIHVDPHAAAIVIDSGIPITMIPLDVTHQVLSTPLRLAGVARPGQSLRSGGRCVARFVREEIAAPNSARAPGRCTIPRSLLICCARPFTRGARSMSPSRREPADHRDDRRRLVGGHRPKGQCAVHDKGRRRRVLRIADGKAGAPALTAAARAGNCPPSPTVGFLNTPRQRPAKANVLISLGSKGACSLSRHKLV